MSDTHCCEECEPVVTDENNLCERCQSDWVSWLMAKDIDQAMQGGASLLEAMKSVTLAAYAPGRTPDNDAYHLSRLSGWLPDTSGPEGTPF